MTASRTYELTNVYTDYWNSEVLYTVQERVDNQIFNPVTWLVDQNVAEQLHIAALQGEIF